MASTANILSSEKFTAHLRPVDTHRDLGAVADLIETCFKDTLDPDGQNYLRHLRDVARFSYLSSWAATMAEDASLLPLSGYIWTEEDRVVGNISLIPFTSLGRRCYLIANVAVLPEYRCRGIATQLTARALQHVRAHHGASAWLQVRDDNPAAIHIYETQGFQERARRTTWFNAQPAPRFTADGYQLGSRLTAHWPWQRSWLEWMYPAEFSWHLPVNWQAIQPGLKGDFYRFFSFSYPKHWAVADPRKVYGVLTWMHHPGKSDYLLLAAPQDASPAAIQALLIHARKDLSPRRRLSLNIPAGFVDDAIKNAGFSAQQTLIWMEVKF
jgi:ribosomal protein S18 acetylase RimI-like enzyme